MGGLTWGEDLVRDCAELRKLETWGIYPHGYHEQNCPLDHTIQHEREAAATPS